MALKRAIAMVIGLKPKKNPETQGKTKKNSPEKTKISEDNCFRDLKHYAFWQVVCQNAVS